MNDTDWSAELTAYIDGELPPGQAKALEAELAKNPGLRAQEQQLRHTVSLMEQVPAPEPSAALRRAVLSGIDTPSLAERVRAFLTPGRLVPLSALVTAAVVAVVLVRGGEKVPAGMPVEDEQLLIARNMEVLEDLDLVGLDGADDLDVVASLHELEVQ